jgi:hypothetical protein
MDVTEGGGKRYRNKEGRETEIEEVGMGGLGAAGKGRKRGRGEEGTICKQYPHSETPGFTSEADKGFRCRFIIPAFLSASPSLIVTSMQMN